jgi:hypothetical protein
MGVTNRDQWPFFQQWSMHGAWAWHLCITAGTYAKEYVNNVTDPSVLTAKRRGVAGQVAQATNQIPLHLCVTDQVARWKLQRGDRCPMRIGDGDGSPALRLATGGKKVFNPGL